MCSWSTWRNGVRNENLPYLLQQGMGPRIPFNCPITSSASCPSAKIGNQRQMVRIWPRKIRRFFRYWRKLQTACVLVIIYVHKECRSRFHLVCASGNNFRPRLWGIFISRLLFSSGACRLFRLVRLFHFFGIKNSRVAGSIAVICNAFCIQIVSCNIKFFHIFNCVRVRRTRFEMEHQHIFE